MIASLVMLGWSLAAPAATPAPTFDPCDTGRRIARQTVCLDAETCGALALWRQAFGPGGTLLAPPVLTFRAEPGKASPGASSSTGERTFPAAPQPQRGAAASVLAAGRGARPPSAVHDAGRTCLVGPH